MKFENIDLIDALRRIMDIHTQNYKEDFEMDSKLIRELAVSESSADKNLLWMSRTNGTHILRESYFLLLYDFPSGLIVLTQVSFCLRVPILSHNLCKCREVFL